MKTHRSYSDFRNVYLCICSILASVLSYQPPPSPMEKKNGYEVDLEHISS